MEFGSLAAGDDDERNGFGSVAISKIFVTQDELINTAPFDGVQYISQITEGTCLPTEMYLNIV